MKDDFPVHHHLFRRTAASLGHEENVESVFSVANGLEDPNLDANFLAQLVKMSGLETLSRPDSKRVWKHYRAKFPDMRVPIHTAMDDAEIAELEDGVV